MLIININLVTLDPSSFRSGLKAAGDKSPKAAAPSGSKPAALARSHTVGGGDGFRRGGTAAGPGNPSLFLIIAQVFTVVFLASSNYTEQDVLKNTTEAVMARQGLKAAPRPKNTGMSRPSDEEFIDAGTKEGVRSSSCFFRLASLINHSTSGRSLAHC